MLNVQARTLKVAPSGREFSKIGDALDAASNGDTVMVFHGNYAEGPILLEKSLVLIGIDYPILNGREKYEVFVIHADHVQISGFEFRNSAHGSLEDPAGIKVVESKHVLIENNRLIDNFFGIYIQYGTNCRIINNVIVATALEEQRIGNGIHCWKSDSIQIIGNQISGHRDGIYFEFVTHSVIWRNISRKNIRYGLHFMFSHDDAYIGNVFRENGAGVAVMYTRNVKMINNTFMDNWGDASYALLFKDISDSYLIKNRFDRNSVGIMMEGSSRIQIKNNQFNRNGWALKIQASCMDNVLSENNFLSNSIDVSTNGHLVLSKFESNYWDKYEGYDLNKDQTGDVPYRPLSLFAVIAEKNPPAVLLFRSLIMLFLERSEKILPTLTPEDFIDLTPSMKPYPA